MDLPLSLDPASGIPLYRQLYAGLRQAILSGRLPPGTRLPASRELARQLGLARKTVTDAYAELMSEGYLEGRPGAGSFVSPELPDEAIAAPRPRELPRRPAPPAGREPPRLSAWARALPTPPPPPSALPYDFPVGVPAADAFPWDLWRQLLARHLRAATPALLRYGDAAGLPALRAAVATSLGRTRAVRASPEQVVITAGTVQGLDLLARLLVEPGDLVALEEPGYQGARRAFLAAGARLLPIPVDAEGLLVERLPTGDRERPKLVYVTPSHQYPTGVTLSLARRLQLLAWAEGQGALVVEDDYDSEFRYAARPLESLQGLDRGGQVVYLGSFSKTLSPALRIGFAVLPAALVEPFTTAKWLTDRHAPMLEQLGLADFLEEGHFERHVRRLRRLYQERRDAVLTAFARHLAGVAEPLPSESGLHLLARLAPGLDENAFVAAARRRGVGLYPLGPYFHGPPAFAGLVVGYAPVPAPLIAVAFARLRALKALEAVGARR